MKALKIMIGDTTRALTSIWISSQRALRCSS